MHSKHWVWGTVSGTRRVGSVCGPALALFETPNCNLCCRLCTRWCPPAVPLPSALWRMQLRLLADSSDGWWLLAAAVGSLCRVLLVCPRVARTGMGVDGSWARLPCRSKQTGHGWGLLHAEPCRLPAHTGVAPASAHDAPLPRRPCGGCFAHMASRGFLSVFKHDQFG